MKFLMITSLSIKLKEITYFFSFEDELHGGIRVSGHLNFEHGNSLLHDSFVVQRSQELRWCRWNADLELRIASSLSKSVLRLAGNNSVKVSGHIFDCQNTDTVFGNETDL